MSSSLHDAPYRITAESVGRRDDPRTAIWLGLVLVLSLPAAFVSFLAGACFSGSWFLGESGLLGVTCCLGLGAYALWCGTLMYRGWRTHLGLCGLVAIGLVGNGVALFEGLTTRAGYPFG